MIYSEALKITHSFSRLGKNPGLYKIREILNYANNPQNNLKFVHVAGTNGKGSVCTLLANVLKFAGYKTGLFISPFITEFRERIQINGIPVEKELFCEAVEVINKCVDNCEFKREILSEFEFTTAVAFYCFNALKCEIVVLETGLGGRMDTTNVINSPLCTVITSVSLDHTAILGESYAQIAAEKCGIIKENGITITVNQKPEVMEVIKQACKKLNNKLIFSEQINLISKVRDIRKNRYIYNGEPINLNLIGTFQDENAKAVLSIIAVLNESGYKIERNAINIGFETVVHPARCEVVSLNPLVIFDGAHNPGAMQSLKETLDVYLPNKKKIGVIAMMKDKDSRAGLKIMSDVFSRVYTCTISDNPRCLNSDELYSIAKSDFNEVIKESDCFTAYKAAYNYALETDCTLVICGSLFLAAELRNFNTLMSTCR